MLVGTTPAPGDQAAVQAGRSGARARRAWLWAFVASSLLTLGLAVSLLPHFKDSAELVRMRNALLLDPQAADPAWTPERRPADFAVDSGNASARYTDIVRRHSLIVPGDDWATALAIGQHLLIGGRRSSSAIQSDLDRTYERITRNGEGYCGDYADVFTGLAHAAGLATRPWAFSFDGFGGRGHIFNEVWDRQSSRWIAIDVFNNLYFVGQTGEPLSAMALHEALASGAPLQTVRVRSDVRAGFPVEGKALDFYRRGAGEWYMWWGTNVFEYDDSPVVRVLGRVHRAAEQLGGIVTGVHPRVRILEAPANEFQRQALDRLRLSLLALVAMLFFCCVTLMGWLWAGRQVQQRSKVEHAP
jgi:hypothetical protein